MASEMTITEHICEGLLRLILPEDTMTVDLEVMTLKGLHIFRQDKHSKTLIPWSEDHKPPSSFLKRLRETQGKPSKDFLESVVDKNVKSPTIDLDITVLAQKWQNFLTSR